MAVYHDSPAEVAPEALRAHAGIVRATGGAPPLEVVTLPAGRHAVLTHRGPCEGIGAAWDALCAGWLPGSGERPGGTPFEVYLNRPTDAAPGDLLTEICPPPA